MSAPAPATAPQQRRMLRIRLSDPAAAAAYGSLLFAVLVLIFPVSFPRMLADGWFTGRLTPALIVIAGLLNAGVYLRVALGLVLNRAEQDAGTARQTGAR